MKYFKAKVVRTDGEVKSFVPPIHEPSTAGQHLMYDRHGDIEYHGLSDDIDPEEVITLQHEECEVEEVLFVEIEENLKGSRLYKEINAQVEQKIREKYSIGDEFSILKLEKTDPEYIAYQQFIDECRENGRMQKIALGLKQ
jgi:hypothetical protein